MNVSPIKTRIFQESENLFLFILEHVPILHDSDILVITSKIVALAEGRTAPVENEETKERIIREESEWVLRTKYVWLTLKDNMVMASAGIDESNANGKLILLPKDSYESAMKLRSQLCAHFQINDLGILITDSRTMPLRAGVTGVALGYAGFKGIRDYRGTPDIFDRPFHFSRTDVADSLATAAVVVMGEGNEQYPLACISEAPVKYCDVVDRNELSIDLSEDMYAPFFAHVLEKRTPSDRMYM